MLSKSNLHNYQLKAVDIILKKRKCALFLDMGLGKTTTTLTAISKLLNGSHVSKVLIVAPLRVANSVWKQEAAKWKHLQSLDISICTGSLGERKKALDNNSQITIINRENIPWLVSSIKWAYDMVVIDESSSFKSSKSKRFKALKSVNKYVKSMVLLSGTPSPNGEMDLWSQVYLLDNGQRLESTITAFKRKYFQPVGYMNYNYKILPNASDQIRNKIKDICVTMKSEDYLTLPDMIYTEEYITLPNNAKKQYKELEKEFMLSLENGSEIIANSSSTLANKLLQLCNGAVYKEDKSYEEMHDLKIQSLKEIIEDNPNENFLIAYNFKSDLKRIKHSIPNVTELSSDQDVSLWNEGKIKILLTHPASAGHGLNLQHGGNVVIWFGLNWSLELYQQFNKRLHRQGQLKPVRIIHIVVRHCLDERVMLALKNKAKNQEELIQFLKCK